MFLIKYKIKSAWPITTKQMKKNDKKNCLWDTTKILPSGASSTLCQKVHRGAYLFMENKLVTCSRMQQHTKWVDLVAQPWCCRSQTRRKEEDCKWGYVLLIGKNKSVLRNVTDINDDDKCEKTKRRKQNKHHLRISTVLECVNIQKQRPRNNIRTGQPQNGSLCHFRYRTKEV